MGLQLWVYSSGLWLDSFGFCGAAVGVDAVMQRQGDVANQ